MQQQSSRKSTLVTGAVLAASLASSAQSKVWDVEGDLEGDRFGHSLALVGDINGDGVPELVSGAIQLGVGNGYARVLSGADGSTLFTVTHTDLAPTSFGHSVGAGGDLNADGVRDFVVGSYAYSGTSPGFARAFSGKDASILHTWQGIADRDSFGASCTIIEDVNDDGFDDALIGATEQHENKLGYVQVFSGADGSELYTIHATSGLAFSRFGNEVASLGDIDGDGAGDFVVGHPQPQDLVGRAVIYSGRTGTLIFELLATGIGDSFGTHVENAGDVNADGINDVIASRSTNTGTGYVKVFSGADGATLYEFASDIPLDRQFGEGIAAAGDVDRDGYGDFAVSSPNYPPLQPGYVRVYSGRTGQLLYRHDGEFYLDNLGASLAFVGDTDGDGFPELAAGSGYTCCGTNFPAGFVRLLSPCPFAATFYCTAKANSLGCVPEIGALGLPTSTGADDFFVTAENVLNNKVGLMIYGFAPLNVPFMGGRLCVAPPIRRAPPQSSGGNPPPSDCSGAYAFHVTQAFMASEGLAPGTAVFGQFWSRDISHPDLSGVGLTDAVHFTVCP